MKTKIIKSILLTAFTVFAILFYGCEKDEPSNDNDETKLIINDNIVTIDETTLSLTSSSTELDQGTYRYKYTGTHPNFTTNSVIVGQDGYGYMRKVISVSANGNDIVLQTEQAKLTDVIKQCDISDSIRFDINNKKAYINGKSVNMKVVYLATGVSIKQLKNGNGGINLTNTTLYSGAIGSANLTAKITDGYIGFEPTFYPEFKVGLTRPYIKKIGMSAKGDINFDCNLQLVCNVPVSYSKEIAVPTPQAIFEVGPVWFGPVPAFIDLAFYVGFETNLNFSGTFETGCDANSSVEYGARYYQGDWSTIWNKSSNFNQHPITWNYDGNVFARAYVSPQISVKIAGITGPYIEVEPYLKFDGEIQNNNWQWELNGGLDGNLGFDVGTFGYEIADYYTTLLNWETQPPIASDNGTIQHNPPVADFTANTTSITAGEIVNFTDQSTNTPTSWSWDFGDGATSTSQNPSHTYNTAGTYTVSLTSTNSYGSNTKTKNDYITCVSSGGLWKDNFDTYQLNQFPDNWAESGNGEESYVTDENYYSSPYSISMEGSSGGCWEGIIYREYNNSYQHYQFEFTYLYTGEGQVGCHPSHGSFGLKSNTDWTSGYGRGFIGFDTDMNIICYPSKTNIGSFSINQWVKIKIDYQTFSNYIKLKYYVNDQFVHEENADLVNGEDELKYIQLGSSDTRCLFDDIKVIKLNK